MCGPISVHVIQVFMHTIFIFLPCIFKSIFVFACMCGSAHDCGCVVDGSFSSIITVYQLHTYLNPSPPGSSLLIPFGSLQLIGGAGPFGRLQLNVDNNFHWLCDAHFSWSEAVVACRQLGYSGVIAIVNNSL